MKVLFLFCVVVNTHSLFTQAGTELPHSIHKRQIDPLLFQACQSIILEEQCNNGLVQESVNLALQCGRGVPFEAELLVVLCQQNFRDDYCGLAIINVEDVIELQDICAAENCTIECQSSLVLLREKLGCCLDQVFNNSLIPSFYFPDQLNYTLWSSCGVETDTEKCTSSTVEVSAE